MNKTTQADPDALTIWTEDVRALGERAAALGREICTCDYPYHALWGLLRVSGMTGSLRYEEDALAPVLSKRIHDGTRVLIAGSADTGTLCAVGRAAGSHMPAFTVVDRCPAPLAIIEEFTSRRSIPCRSLHSDLLALDEPAGYDVVLINYTLSYIPPESRVELFKRLASALVPGGTLVCATKLASAAKPEGAAAVDNWAERGFKKIRAAKLGACLSDDELRALLRMGAEARVSRRRDNPSLSELEAYVTHAGLTPSEELATARERALSADGIQAAELDPSIILSAQRPR